MQINKQWIIDNKFLVGIGTILLIGIIAIIYLSWPSPKPIDTQQIINNAKIELEKQYVNQLKEKDMQIFDGKSRLVISESKYKTLVNRYNDLQKEKVNVAPPKTNQELRDRFTALGYPPLPAK